MRDGLSWVNLQGALMAGGWKAGGQLCCLLGLSPCWAVIKLRPWCEAFCWDTSGLLPLVILDVSLRRDVTKCLLFVFWIHCTFPHRTLFHTMGQIHHSQMPHTCSESQVVIVNLLDIKHKIRLAFDALH